MSFNNGQALISFHIIGYFSWQHIKGGRFFYIHRKVKFAELLLLKVFINSVFKYKIIFTKIFVTNSTMELGTVIEL